MLSVNTKKQAPADRIIGILCVNLATLVWATNMVLGRLLRDSAGPLTISAVRFSIAALIFLFLLRREPSPEARRLGENRWLLAGMAATGVILFSATLYLGLRYTTAVNCTLINALAPLVTFLLAAVFLRAPVSGQQIAGSVAAFAGVVFLISGGAPSLISLTQLNSGDLIVFGSVIVWGVYSVIGSKVMRRRSPLSATALSTFIALPLLYLLAAAELQFIPLRLDVRTLLSLLYIGAVPSALGFYAWNIGVARLGPGGAAVFYNTLPLYGAILGVAVLGEPVTASHIIGGFLIIAGGVWAAYHRPPAAGAGQKTPPEKH